MERTSHIQPRHFSRPDRTTVVLFIVFIVLATITAVFAFNFFSNLIKGWTVTNLPGAPVADNSSGANANPGSSQPLQPSNGPSSKPWDGKSRINILFVGLDYRICDSTHDYETCDICDKSYLDVHPNDPAKLNKCSAANTSSASHTDTMILFTVDPVTMTAGMLSIPRDLWVEVPDFGDYKINTAYFIGEAKHLPGGGPQKAMDTVSNFLGVPIQYYVRIDFNVFVKLIDEINGITVTPDQDLIIRNSSNYPVTIKAGVPVTLDGVLALSYARERHQTFGGDFDRSKRQQEVIMAIRNRVLTFNMLPTLIAKGPILYKEVSSGVHTNLEIDQVIQIAQLVLSIPADSIQKASIETDALIEARSPDGLSIYLPIPDKIRLLRDQLFAPGSTTQPMAAFTGNSNGSIQTEAARISIQNATNSSGLGETTASYLQSQGLTIAGVSNANGTSDVSAIYTYSSKPYTLSYLASLFGVSSSSIWNSFDPSATTDFIVVLGNSWANNNPMPK